MGRTSRRRNKQDQYRRNGYQLRAVFNDGDETGFIYSYGNSAGQPEFIALDGKLMIGSSFLVDVSSFFMTNIALSVPRAKISSIYTVMNFLADRTIKHGQTVSGLDFTILNEIEGAEKMRLLNTHATANLRHNAPLFELVPRLGWDFPPPPEGKDLLYHEILGVWTLRPKFFLHRDGDLLNLAPDNIKQVDLAVALRHVGEWNVDWYVGLEQEQMEYVMRNSKYFVKVAKILFRPKSVCAYCGLVDIEKLQQCSRCKQTWYCGSECQKKDWKDHKRECKYWKDLRSDKPTKVNSGSDKKA